MRYKTTKTYINAIRELEENKIYIVGAGKYGEIIGKYFDKHKIHWEGYVDKCSKLGQVNGKNIYSYGGANDGYYVISSYYFREEIMKELEAVGIGTERIILYENSEVFFDIYSDIIDTKKYTDRVKVFYRKYSGKSCFIIGNGPSLRIEDLEKIDKEITFASNSIYALYAHTDWRPTYYCAGDPIFCKKMMTSKKNLAKIMDGCEAMFTSVIGEGIEYRNDTNIKNIYYICRMNKKLNNNLPEFSTDCSKQVYLGGTITYDMLQLAVYMGFKQIYLLGMDFNYSVERYEDNTIIKKDICNHMKEIEKEEMQFYEAVSQRYGASYLADIDLQLAAFQAAKDYADKHNIKIYNATRGGKLEVFQRVDFDGLII